MPGINDCWNKIGVFGDSSCAELKQHIHCRNCPVFAAAAVDVLDREPPADYLAHWSAHVGREKQLAERNTHSIIVFRIGAEWLGLPTTVFTEIATPRAIHSLPHRRNGVVLGVANIRGELLACVSLHEVLGVDALPAPDNADPERILSSRLLVIQRDAKRAVCPVDEVHGVKRFHSRELREAPATVARFAATYTKSVLPWRNRSVGVLDDELLFHTFTRSLALATVT